MSKNRKIIFVIVAIISPSIFCADDPDLQCIVRHLASKGVFDEFLATVNYKRSLQNCDDVIRNIRKDFFSNVGLFRTFKNSRIYDCMMKNYISSVQENYLHYHALKDIGIGWRVWRYFNYEEKTKNLLEVVQESMKRIESHCNQLARNQVDFERFF